MRAIATLAALIALAAPAFAQTAPRHPPRHARAARHAARHAAPAPAATGETPIDRGPFTPEANRAYQGGGVVLQGAPGAPPPMPEPTPPGQTPRNAVPVP